MNASLRIKQYSKKIAVISDETPIEAICASALNVIIEGVSACKCVFLSMLLIFDGSVTDWLTPLMRPLFR